MRKNASPTMSDARHAAHQPAADHSGGIESETRSERANGHRGESVPTGHEVDNPRLRAFMRHPLVTCSPSTPITAAAREMKRHNVATLIVIDADDHIVGLVTDRDIALGVAHGMPASAPIERVMTTDVFTFPHDGNIYEAVAVLDTRGARPFPPVLNHGPEER